MAVRLLKVCLIGSFLVPAATVLVAGLLVLLYTAREFLFDMAFFLRDKVTHMAAVQLWVLLTTLLLVVAFLLDWLGPWNADRSMTRIIIIIRLTNYSLVQYTIGLMQLSAARPNDYFQVWAVLLVTLQYSVKIGRPYDKSKQIPVLDLMSSFWTANLLRVQTVVHLKIPLWLTWALNAARIIAYFATTSKAEGTNEESNRFVADYMSYEHEIPAAADNKADNDKKFTMKGYNYLVWGEEQALEDILEGDLTPPKQPNKRKLLKRQRRVIRLDPDKHKELVTLDKIWHRAAESKSGLLGGTADDGDRLKDVCLSFALYKLLRRRFYDLPVHEARLRTPWEKIRRLVCEYILQDEERALRIVSMELYFLQDLFYSKHATMFANGFPFINMVLSLLLVMAVGYIAYPVRYIPERMDPADHNRITHGVLITRVIISLIVIKEVAEIYLYVFSQWTKVLMLCSYVRHRWMRHRLVERVMRVLLCLMNRGKWDEKIRQHNLLILTRGINLGKGRVPTNVPTGIKLQDWTKKAIFKSLQELVGPKLKEKLGKKKQEKLEKKKQEKESEKKKEALARLDLYISSARLPSDFNWALELEVDTHKIIVWHIATCLCEIKYAPDEAKKLRPYRFRSKPFIKKPESGEPQGQDSTQVVDDAAGNWWENYMTAASLSNYCMYMVTRALVPDNGIVAKHVFLEVRREINYVRLDGRRSDRTMQDVFDRLMELLADNKEQTARDDEGEIDPEAPMGAEPERKSREPGSEGEYVDLEAAPMAAEPPKKSREQGAEGEFNDLEAPSIAAEEPMAEIEEVADGGGAGRNEGERGKAASEPDPVVDVYSAAAYGDLERLRGLVEEGGAAAALREPDGNGHHALQHAAFNNHPHVALFIIEHGADGNATDHQGRTALHWAAVRGAIAVADVLMGNGARVEAADMYGYRAVHVAAQCGQTSFLHHIISKYGADFEVLDNEGRSPLHWAVHKVSADTVRLLLSMGANQGRQDKNGCTPLHWAAFRGNSEVWTLLVNASTKEELSLKDSGGFTPVQVAAYKGHQHLSYILSDEEPPRTYREQGAEGEIDLEAAMAAEPPRTSREQGARGEIVIETSMAAEPPRRSQEQGAEEEFERGASTAAEPPRRSRKKSRKEVIAEKLDIGNSLTRQGARLAKDLIAQLGEDEYEAGRHRLWKQLADFWTGYLLYLAVFTRANKHRARLGGKPELLTHLWALLSHAGFLGSAGHGHTLLDQEDLETVNPLS